MYHVGFAVPASQFESIVSWYQAALAPIGYSKQMEFPGQAVGFGPSKHELPFWVSAKAPEPKEGEKPYKVGIHLAFKAKDHETVNEFYEEAIKAGGVCNGKPGLRKEYHPNYYGAFVLVPVGNNVEVVDHTPRN